MSKLRERLAEAFLNAGVRPTAQRYAVLDFLARKPVHATADEIFRAVNRADPRASRATVYNNLRALARARLVREVISEGGGAARYEAGLGRHHHFVCESCGALEDLPWFDLSISAGSILGGREARSYEIVFRGTCAACRDSGPKGR